MRNKSKQFNRLIRELASLHPRSREYYDIMYQVVSTYKIAARDVRGLALSRQLGDKGKINVYGVLVSLPKSERPPICPNTRTVKLCSRPLKIFSHY